MNTRNKKFLHILCCILLLTPSILSCQLLNTSTDTFSPPKSIVTPQILGYITQSRGSNPIEGSIVTLARANAPNTPILTTTTNSDGKFQFDTELDRTIILEDGRYIIEARKQDRASSKIIFSVKDGTTPILSLQQFPLNFPERSKVPPVITVAGIAPDDTLTNDTPRTITVTVASENPLTESSTLKRIPINISLNQVGSANYDSFNVLYSDYNEDHTSVDLAYMIHTLSIPSGHIEMELVSYDNNNNQSILIIPFTNALDDYQRSPTAITPPAATPNTYTKFFTQNVSKNNNIYQINPLDESITVKMYVATNNQNGIMIYRTTDLHIAPRFIGSTSSIREQTEENQLVEYFYFEDLQPTIRGGTIYYYTLRYYNYDTADKTINTSESSNAILVPILPKMTLHQVTPTNDTTYLSLPTCNEDDIISTYCITFTWNVEVMPNSLLTSIMPQIQKTDYLEIYWVHNYNTLLSTTVSTTSLPTLENTHSYTYHFTDATYTHDEHIRGKEYYWYVKSNLTYNHSEKNRTDEVIYKVESYSYPDITKNVSGEVTHGIANNAGYYFTIY